MDHKKYALGEDLLMGFEIIDEQHSELFRRLNSLMEAAYDRRNVREIQSFVMFLAEYMKEHLDLEEELMRKHEYSGFEAHKAEHILFKENYGEIIRKFNEGSLGPVEMVRELEVHVGDWFVNHINKADRTAVAFLKSAGANTH